MTPDDLTYPQPPPMNQQHIDTLHTILYHWPYPNLIDISNVHEIIAHLEALITAPVPSQVEVLDKGVEIFYVEQPKPVVIHIHHSPGDWREDFPPITEGDCMDQ